MKVIIAYRFLVEVEDLDDARALAEAGRKTNDEMLGLEFAAQGIDRDSVAHHIRQLDPAVVVVMADG